MHAYVWSGFVDELEKVAMSALRSRFVVEPIVRGGREIRWVARLGGKKVGYLGTTMPRKGQPAQVGMANLRPQYQGMGLGKKMYGEVMRRLPGQRLASDTREVTRPAARVWEGMRRRGYNVSQRNPAWQQHGPAHMPNLRAWKPSRSGTGSLYTASMPSPKSAIPTPGLMRSI